MSSLYSYPARSGRLIVAPVVALVWLCPAAARADFSAGTSHGLQQALASLTNGPLYHETHGLGRFSLGGNFFAGSASGHDALNPQLSRLNADAGYQLAQAAELAGDQHVYAVMLNGSYDFDTGAALKPHLLGSVGMAKYANAAGSNYGVTGNNDMLPLFRLGAGMSYDMADQWQMSLDYKAGFAGAPGADALGGSHQPFDMHLVNVGMSYRF